MATSPNKWHKEASPKKGSDSPTKPNRPRTPEEKCPICLGTPPQNVSRTDSCCHKFCFVCILEWSKVKAECPLCKQRFRSIIHNIRSEEDYDKYDLPAIPAEPPVAPRRFRYPSTMTGERIELQQYVRNLQTELMLRHSGRRGLSFATQNWALPRHNQPSWLERAHNALSQNRERQQTEQDLRRYSQLLEASENLSREQLMGTMDFRRFIYDRGLWVRALEETEGLGRVRETSVEFFRENPAMIHRLITWLTRELTALFEVGV